MHRWLIKFLRVIDVRLLYAFSYVFIVPPAIAVNKSARHSIYYYFRQRLGYGRIKSAWMTYRNHCAFSEVVIDKFAMYAGQKFEITIDGYDRFHDLSKREKGFVQLSSHIGNYEIAGYSLVAKDKRFNAMVFGGEKKSVMDNRNRLFAGNNIRMIPMEEDMSHLFTIDAALSNGEILSMPADRVFGSQKSFELTFLGETARFPQGPFILAAAREVDVLFVAVMKRGCRHYHITIQQLKTPQDGSTRCKAEILAKEYVSHLENIVLRHTEQWYNYFDFWK